MRNNMMVNNTAYYESSNIEKGSSLMVINNTATGEEFLTLSPIIPKEGFIHRQIKMFDIKANEIKTVVYNRVKEDSYNLKKCNLYVMKDDIGDININVLDKNTVSSFKYKLSPVDLFIKGSNYISTCNTRKNIIHSLNMSKEEKIELFKGVNINDYKINVFKRKEEDINIRANKTFVVQTDKRIADGWDIVPTIEIGVSNATTEGSIDIGSNTGGDLKVLYFTIQQMAFFEFKLKFENKKVEDVFNLPVGLFFDKERQRILGTPMQSGRFSFALIFDNNSTLNGFIEVPILKREL